MAFKKGNSFMIYLSAQPDSFYFLWQLKLQLFDIVNYGLASRYNIHDSILQ